MHRRPRNRRTPCPKTDSRHPHDAYAVKMHTQDRKRRECCLTAAGRKSRYEKAGMDDRCIAWSRHLFARTASKTAPLWSPGGNDGRAMREFRRAVSPSLETGTSKPNKHATCSLRGPTGETRSGQRITGVRIRRAPTANTGRRLPSGRKEDENPPRQRGNPTRPIGCPSRKSKPNKHATCSLRGPTGETRSG